MSDPAALWSLEPDDLDGHTIDELTNYLEAGCEPADPSIDDSPACRIALDALQRLRELAGEYLDGDGDAAEPDPERGWIDAVIAAIPLDAKAGRRFPISFDDPRVAAHVTEGAIRGLIRSIGDDVPGLLVGSVRIGSGDPAPLSVDVALVYGTVLTTAVDRFRHRLRSALPAHVPFTVGDIDIAVVGLIPPSAGDRTDGLP